MKGDETFRVRTTCPANDRAQKPVRVNREKPPCDLKEAVSRLSILRCSRVRHPRSSSMLVTLDVLFSGLYLGYLRGGSFPTKKCSAPPPPKKKILLSLQFVRNYIGKSPRRDEVSAHEVSIPCLRTPYDKEHGLLHHCHNEITIEKIK